MPERRREARVNGLDRGGFRDRGVRAGGPERPLSRARSGELRGSGGAERRNGETAAGVGQGRRSYGRPNGADGLQVGLGMGGAAACSGGCPAGRLRSSWAWMGMEGRKTCVNALGATPCVRPSEGLCVWRGGPCDAARPTRCCGLVFRLPARLVRPPGSSGRLGGGREEVSVSLDARRVPYAPENRRAPSEVPRFRGDPPDRPVAVAAGDRARVRRLGNPPIRTSAGSAPRMSGIAATLRVGVPRPPTRTGVRVDPAAERAMRGAAPAATMPRAWTIPNFVHSASSSPAARSRRSAWRRSSSAGSSS